MTMIKFITALLVATVAVAPQLAWGQPQVQPRIFVNPGHGGHDNNDRPEPFYNQGQQRRVEYYESNSNLTHGLALAEMLRDRGYDVALSRYTNTSDDDLNLTEICQLAANSGADLFYAVHSNDTDGSRAVNFPLGLYRGYTDDPAVAGSDVLSRIIVRNLMTNQATNWDRDGYSRGDWSFYNWGYGVGLGVLRYNKLPAVLVESSFHGYLAERERLLNTDYMRLEAFLEANGIDGYFGRGPVDRGMIAGTVRFDSLRTDLRRTFGSDCYVPANSMPVTLLDAQGNEHVSYLTDDMNNGFFSFENLAPGTYTVSVDGAQDRKVRVSAGNVTYCSMMIGLQAGEEPINPDSVSTPNSSRGHQIKVDDEELQKYLNNEGEQQ